MSCETCPWCESALEIMVDGPDEQSCPECLTSWRYEDAAESEMPLAA